MRNALPPRALLGTSAAILELQADTRLAEQHDTQVLITGEPGVGKRALALLIHSRSSRSSAGFESVDSSGTSDIELGRTLFGDRDATGSVAADRGLLQAAHQGTLFINGLDEISPRMQERLSRVLETEDVLSDGSEEEWAVFDVRIIVGAGPALFDRVKSGGFSDDLFYRLNVIHLVVPPLRDRLDDLPAHLHDCLTAYAQAEGNQPPEVSADALEQLKAYRWPGNDHELDQLARLLVRRGRKTITSGDLPREFMLP